MIVQIKCYKGVSLPTSARLKPSILDGGKSGKMDDAGLPEDARTTTILVPILASLTSIQVLVFDSTPRWRKRKKFSPSSNPITKTPTTPRLFRDSSEELLNPDHLPIHLRSRHRQPSHTPCTPYPLVTISLTHLQPETKTIPRR